jgi:CRISPR/Cas system CSM-associated protein Csm4 (group 5 of RAMP superfamily)
MVVAAITAAAMGGAHRATAIGFVSAFSRLPVHPANTKANNRAMILIRAIPFCRVSKQERRREWNAIIGIDGWKYDPRENRESARSRLTPGCIRMKSGEGNGPVWAVEGHAWKCKQPSA